MIRIVVATNLRNIFAKSPVLIDPPATDMMTMRSTQYAASERGDRHALPVAFQTQRSGFV